MKPAATSPRPAGHRRTAFPGGRAFTLIEVMVVVAIIGMIMAMGIPSLYQMFHRDGFQKSVNDVVEVCNRARARAILQQEPADAVFYPQDHRCEVAAGVAREAGQPELLGGSTVSARFPDDTTIEMLDVNLRERKEDEEVRVRFHPNGTSDEMTLIVRSRENEWRKISLEVTTGLVTVETDPNKWK